GHRFGQAEARDLRAHHAAAVGVAVEDHALIPEREEIARDGQRRRAGADQGDALAVLPRCGRGKIAANIALIVGRDALQPTDRDWLILDPDAAASRLARAIAGAAEDAGENVRLPIDRPGRAELASGDQPDVFRHLRVR